MLSRRLSFDLAAVVSASHNPFADNGIKFFNSRGTKLDDDAELEIEGLLDEETGERVGGVRSLEGAFDDYIRELRTAFQLDLSGMQRRARLRERRHLPRGSGDLPGTRRGPAC